MANKNNKWDKYNSRPPRILHIELAAPYDEIINNSGLDTFVKVDYKSNDNNAGFSMMPWVEPNKSPVIIRYGLSKPIFELPPSGFVIVSFQAAHVVRMHIKPMLKPLISPDALVLSKQLIELLDNTSLTRISGNTVTLDEVLLRMQLLAKDMDKQSFEIGRWEKQQLHGTTAFSLNIEVIKDLNLEDPNEQLYSIEFLIYDLNYNLEDKLEKLMMTARTKVQLTDNGKPCPLDNYDCDIPDVRIYLDILRKEKLIPIK